MSRKTKQHKAHAKPLSPHAMDSAALAAEAGAALAAGHIKEATELYKELVKRERRPDWVDGLASCYTRRAHDLAAKGMVTEALVLWRNRTQLCGKPLAEEPYFAWLLQAGEQAEMFRLLNDKSLPETARGELEAHLAATVLTAPDKSLVGLPADSPLLRHKTAALGALAAYHRGEFTALGDELQAIPFRSPYRDLKPALKALALLQTDAEAARALIARLPSGGPFERLAAALRAAVAPGGGWLAAMRGLDEDCKQLVLDIKGCPDGLRPFFLELAKLGETPAAAPLFDLLQRHRRAMPGETLAGFCVRLLPHLGERLVSTDFFYKLPEEEKAHVLALEAEQRGAFKIAESEWREMLTFLYAAPDQKLRAALILRHMAAIRRDGGVDSEAFTYLKKSLELDPDDRETTLTVIRILRSDNDLVQARVYLDQALPRFPRDAGILLEAVEVALAGKAFKKAVGLAKQVLELDPINPQVRGLIGRALFSHARKQIKAANYPAAQKELDAAEEWLRAASDRATLKLLRAFVETQADAADARLREAVADFGGSLVGGFHLLVEAAKVGSDPKALLARSGIDLAAAPAPETVIALAHALNAAQDGKKALRSALDPLRAALKRATKARFSEAEQLLVCEALQRIKENELLGAYAEAALKRWRDRPVFVYLEVIARYGSDMDIDEVPDRDYFALDKAAEDARKQGDQRTASRIRALLAPPMADNMPFPDDDPFDGIQDGNPRAALEMLLAMEGEEAFLEMLHRQMGKQLFAELKKQAGGNRKELARILIDIMVDEAMRSGSKPGGFSPPPVSLPPPRKPQPFNPHRPPMEIQKDLFDE